MPILHWVASQGNWEIAFPSPAHEKTLGWQYQEVPWEDKIEKAYFRGQISHPSYTLASPSQIKLIPRIRLMRLAKEHPDYFDVAFTGLDQASEGEVRIQIARWAKENGVQLQRPDLFASSLPRFKYLVNLDGVVAAFRMATLIGAGSVVLMQESHTREFFMGSLTPWVHYVPINYSLADLSLIHISEPTRPY